MEERLKKIYYSTNGYWKGLSAITKLADAANVSYDVAKTFLLKQPIFQIYLPAPKKLIRPKFENTIPNETHQMDLLFLPTDTIRRKRFKYCLTVIDIASRFKGAEPLSSKNANEVSSALVTIYNRGGLKYPKLIHVDSGNEFKGAFNQLLKKHNILVRRGIPKNHRQQALVENFNKVLAERLFSYQYHQEMTHDSRNTEWVGRLQRVVNALNNEHLEVIKMTPAKAIKKKELALTIKKVKGEADTSIFTKKVRYLYQPGEAEGVDENRRATDPIWSTRIYEVESILETNPPVYYLREPGPKRAFVKEELQIVK
jgi:transposase InsO family protein